MFVAYISATGLVSPDVCNVTVGARYERMDLHAFLPVFFFGLLPLHAVEGGVDGAAGTSNLSGSLEGTTGVAFGDIVGWYFESAGIMPPFDTT